ncbi:hypothetical protein FHG87_004289 [Trinorchestia longiramus]|nr:hypothetical protein FHG87_004289 [Trinorchestia longiramus]
MQSHFTSTPLPLVYQSHPTRFPLTSHSHPTRFPLTSYSHPTRFPLSSYSHPTRFPLSSYSHPTRFPLSSYSHPTRFLLASLPLSLPHGFTSLVSFPSPQPSRVSSRSCLQFHVTAIKFFCLTNRLFELMKTKMASAASVSSSDKSKFSVAMPSKLTPDNYNQYYLSGPPFPSPYLRPLRVLSSSPHSSFRNSQIPAANFESFVVLTEPHRTHWRVSFPSYWCCSCPPPSLPPPPPPPPTPPTPTTTHQHHHHQQHQHHHHHQKHQQQHTNTTTNNSNTTTAGTGCGSCSLHLSPTAIIADSHQFS